MAALGTKIVICKTQRNAVIYLLNQWLKLTPSSFERGASQPDPIMRIVLTGGHRIVGGAIGFIVRGVWFSKGGGGEREETPTPSSWPQYGGL